MAGRGNPEPGEPAGDLGEGLPDPPGHEVPRGPRRVREALARGEAAGEGRGEAAS